MNFFQTSDDYLTKLAGLALVLMLHLALIFGAWHYKLISPPAKAATLFVNLINLQLPKVQEKPLELSNPHELPKPPELAKPAVKKVKLTNLPPVSLSKAVPILVSTNLATSAVEPIAPVQTEPVKMAEVKSEFTAEITLKASADSVPKPSAPMVLSTELSVFCPQRAMPNYPAASRRQNEQGQVVLRVELDEAGRIASARVATSSGYKRLDEAGLAAIKNWQCNPSTQNGAAVRAVALQPFDFILEGR